MSTTSTTSAAPTSPADVVGGVVSSVLTGGLTSSVPGAGILTGPLGMLAWWSNPHNVQRAVFVVGGVAAMIAGLRMLADVGGPVGAVGSAVKHGTDQAVSATTTAAKLAAVA